MALQVYSITGVVLLRNFFSRTRIYRLTGSQK